MDNPEKLVTQDTQDEIHIREHRRGKSIIDNPEKLVTQDTQDEIHIREHRRGKSIIDNPEKLETQDTQDKENQNKDTTQYVLNTSIQKQPQIPVT